MKPSVLLNNNLPKNMLDYSGSPSSPDDRRFLAFSDQGAWFAYGFPSETGHYGGFSGPFLMTQENGVWSSPVLSQLKMINYKTKEPFNWNNFTHAHTSFNSHLEQSYERKELKIDQTLYYSSPHTAIIITQICNLSDNNVLLQPGWQGTTFMESLHFKNKGNAVKILSDKSSAIGYIKVLGDSITSFQLSDTNYILTIKPVELKPGETHQLLLSQSFIFPEYDVSKELEQLNTLANESTSALANRICEKENQLQSLYEKLDTSLNDPVYKNLLSKLLLTLQNNWRIPAGELKHSGLFPSYHYKWFHGFWAWDSWKHAVALAQYDVELAREQVRAMYDFQDIHGFIADCIYRDTTIENHNYRNTKPPLSAWAVWKVYEKEKNSEFLEELYPKILKQHKWWYDNRDNDNDGICEYGSTDGTLVAAKWESGMDNAVRFDKSKILKNSKIAYSLDQESVDLNSYLYAEKLYLVKIAEALQKKDEAQRINSEADTLKTKIQMQFFDSESGWFYDTSIDGKAYIRVMGCEGWIPLWANVASQEQAIAVKDNMMKPKYFNTKVPFQTLSADHPKFNPEGGYWRGPNWIDQSYFGVKGLQNYGFHKEANEATYKLMHNADGVLLNGKSIRENYNPITGKGLESENFSWSAAHYLLLLINE